MRLLLGSLLLGLGCSGASPPEADAAGRSDAPADAPADAAGRDGARAADAAGPDAGASPPVHFLEVGGLVGLGDEHRVPAFDCLVGPREECESNVMAGGAAVGDIDGDGTPELLVTQLDGPPRLYRRGEDGRYEDVAAAWGLAEARATNGAAFADIDRDGDLDLVLTSLGVRGARYRLYMQQGGRFVDEALVRGVAFEGDELYGGQSVAVGDYDGDGWPDLHLTEWLDVRVSAPHQRLLHNLGASAPGFFEDVTLSAGVAGDQARCLRGEALCRTYGFASAFADLDGDLRPDLLVVADFGNTRLFWNEGGGRFSEGLRTASLGGDENGMGSTVGDFDGDGDLDWFVTSVFDPSGVCARVGCQWGSSGNRLYRNRGDRTFEDATDLGVRDAGWGWGTAFFDFDNDGDLDLVATNGMRLRDLPFEDAFNDDRMRLWENEGGAFRRRDDLGFTDRGSGKGLVVFDAEGDGDLDVYVVNNGGRGRFFRNQGGDARPWLRVALEGTATSPEGLGARVRVRAGGREQVRELASVTHFLGQSERVAHFGLGEAERVEELVVQWPSGRVSILRDVAARQLLQIREPE